MVPFTLATVHTGSLSDLDQGESTLATDRDSAPMSPSAPAGYEYAGAWIRLFGTLIDSVIGIVPIMLVLGLVVVAHGGGVDYFDYLSDPGRSGWATGVFVYLLTSGVMIAWLALWQAKAGASPGMMLLRLRVRASDALGPPSIASAAIRNLITVMAVMNSVTGQEWVDNLLSLVGLAAYAAIGVSIAKSPTHQGFHDRLAGGTYVLHRVH